MKTLFKGNLALLLLLGLMTSFGCHVEKANLDEFVDQQESFSADSRAQNVTVKGTIVSFKSKEPCSGVLVTIGDFDAVTDQNGDFTITLDETTRGGILKVEKEGNAPFKAPVDFRNYRDNEMVDWYIEMPQLLGTVQFVPGVAQDRTFFYLGERFEVNIPADVATEPLDISFGPTGTVVGKGISGNFAVVGWYVGTPKEAFEFDNKICVSYDAFENAVRGGIGGLNSRAAAPETTPGAFIAAANVNGAILDARRVFFDGGSYADVNAAIINGIYHGADEISINESGDAELCSTLEGCHYPGNGVLTEDGKIKQIDENGQPVEGAEEELIDMDGNVENIPHQSTADGGG